MTSIEARKLLLVFFDDKSWLTRGHQVLQGVSDVLSQIHKVVGENSNLE